MLKTTPAFTQSYYSLNPEQRNAVDVIDGPVMVIAGPGTGKTQILATRIANILLKTDTNPSSILALTFTESGAQAMKKRLISLIGETAYSVNIQTFHSFCSDVISTHPEFFSLALNSEALSDLDRFQLFEDIIQQGHFESIKPVNAPLLYLSAIMSNIQNLKREGVTPERFQRILDDESLLIEQESEHWKKTEREKRKKNLQKNVELLQLYIQYQKELEARHRYDFEDMISLTVQAFKTQELLLLEYQEKLQFFLIDEYQDTNSAQNEVIQLLASYWEERANVFVVGDPNQSIYRFQGASLENTVSFLTTYPNAVVITLQQNYRSTQLILDAAKAVIDHQQLPEDSPLRLEQSLLSQTGTGELISVFEAPSATLEHVYIAEKIHSLIQSGVRPDEIAVIYRNNSESHPIADTLSRWGIQYEIEGGSDVLRHPIITQLITFLSVLRDIRTVGEDVNLFTLLNYEWLQLHPLVILKSVRFANEKKIALFSLITDSGLIQELAEKLPTVEKEALEKISEFAKKLAYWSGLDAQVTFVALFEVLITESGFLSYLLNKPNGVELLNLVNTFFSEIKRQVQYDHQLNLEKFLHSIEIMLEHNLHLSENDLNVKEAAVRLVTAHKSKGQEWPYVFITGLLDKKWGNSVVRNLIPLPEGILQFSQTTKENKNDDDRRLFYVAITRAKKKIYLTYSASVQSGNASRETTPSLFLHELPDELRKIDKEFEAQHDMAKLLAKLMQPRITIVEPSIEEKQFIASVLERFKLSSTALNTYLECPYKFKLQVLLKVPRAKPIYMSFGTAIHNALEFLFRFMKEHDGQIPQLNSVLLNFEQALKAEALRDEDFYIRLAQGQTLLTKYYQQYHTEFTTPLFVEKPFGVGFSRPMLDDIPLSGKMDKIELLNPQARTVKVIDYKTGRAKTRNEIEGKTQNSTGNYKRQLVFYKLLADLDNSFKLTVEQAEFDFVQPKDNDTFVKHTFTITKDEVEELKVLIHEVMVKIRNQEFPRTDDPSLCKECLFTYHCWPDGISTINTI